MGDMRKLTALELGSKENAKEILAVIDPTYAVAKRKFAKTGTLPEFEPCPLQYQCNFLTN